MTNVIYNIEHFIKYTEDALNYLKIGDLVVLKAGIKKTNKFELLEFIITDIIIKKPTESVLENRGSDFTNPNNNNPNNGPFSIKEKEIISFKGLTHRADCDLITEFSYTEHEFTKEYIYRIYDNSDIYRVGFWINNSPNKKKENEYELAMIEKQGFVFDRRLSKDELVLVSVNDLIHVLVRFGKYDYRRVNFVVTEIVDQKFKNEQVIKQIFKCKQLNIVDRNSFDFGEKEYTLSTNNYYTKILNLKRGIHGLKNIIYDNYKCRNNHKLAAVLKNSYEDLIIYCSECNRSHKPIIGCYLCNYDICSDCLQLYHGSKIIRNIISKRMIREYYLLLELIKPIDILDD
jgi:hypothetical protein